MKASELIAALQTEINLNGDLELKISVDDDGIVDRDLVGIATKFEDEEGKTPDYFMLCDDGAYDILHAGGDDEEVEDTEEEE